MTPLASPKLQIDLKHHNLSLVYMLLLEAGPLSRIELAKRTGLSATSMTRIVSRLTEMGLVAEQASAGLGTTGRPATRIDVRADAAYCLCVDLTVYHCKLAVFDVRKNFIAYRELHIPAHVAFEELADEIADMLPELAESCGIPLSKIRRCGVSLSGHVLNDTGRIAASSQFKFLNVDAKGILENTLHIPVTVDNDCKCALIGENTFLQREKRPAGNIVYIEFGWGGVGSAVMIDGRLLRGTRNAAGEIGHITAVPDGALCNCGRRGCFETVLSAQAIVRRAQAINPAYSSIEAITAALWGRDERLDALMDEVADFIAVAINDVSCAYNPDVVILNGALVTTCGACFIRAKEHFEERLITSLNPNMEIRIARMGTNASMYGVGCVAMDEELRAMLMKLEI